MHLIVLVRLQRGAGQCNVSFDPILEIRNLRLGDTDTAAGSKCPDVPANEQADSSKYWSEPRHGAASDCRTGDPPQAAEDTEMCQGCKGELAHPLGHGATCDQRWIA